MNFQMKGGKEAGVAGETPDDQPELTVSLTEVKILGPYGTQTAELQHG